MSNPFDEAVSELPPPLASGPDVRRSWWQPSTDTARLNTSVQIAKETPPEQSARILKMQSKTGLPVEVIKRNLEEVEGQAARSDFDAEKFRGEYPALAKWIASNPQHAALAQDDMGDLTALDRTLNFGKNFGLAMAAAPWRANVGLWGAMRAPVDIVSRYVTGPLTGRLLPADPFAVMSATFAKRQANAEAVAKQVRGDQAGAGFVEKSIYSGAESLAQNLILLPAAVMSGSPAPMLAAMGTITGGEAYGKARDKGVPIPVALSYGLSQAAIEVATEKMPASWLLKDLALRVGFKRMVMRQLASEIPGEQAATLLQDLNEWAILNPDKPFRSYIDERPGAAAQTLIASIVGVGGQVSIVQAMDRAANGKPTSQLFFEELGKGVSESKTYKRLPEKMREIIENATKDGPIENVHQPIEAWVTYWQGRRMDPRGVAAELIGDLAQYDEAVATGGDFQIPLADYATKISTTEHAKFFDREVRLHPEEWNTRETEQFEAANEAEEKAAAEAQAAVDKAAAGPQNVEEAFTKIRENIAAKLVAAGVEQKTADDYAVTQEAAFRQFADRAGISAEALFERYVGGDRLAIGTGQEQAAGGTEMGQQQVQQIPLDQIEHGESAMPGGKMMEPGAQDRIKQYAAMPTPFPAISLIQPEQAGGKYMVEDGSHRVEAARLRGDKTIAATLPQALSQSAIGNDGTFGPKNPSILFQGDTIDGATGAIVPGPWVYSELENQIERAKMNVAPAEQWKKFIAGLSSKGVKKEEVEWSGVMDWLDTMEVEKWEVRFDGGTVQPVASQSEGSKFLASAVKNGVHASGEVVKLPDRVTKQDLLSYLADNGVKLDERVLGGASSFNISFGEWQEDAPDLEFIKEEAQEYLDSARISVSKRQGVPKGDVSDADAFERAVEIATERYDSDPERPQTREIEVEANGKTYRFIATTQGGDFDLFAPAAQGNELDAAGGESIPTSARPGHMPDDPQIEAAIQSWLGEKLDVDYSEEGAPFEDYTLPGGENYQVLLLTLPDSTAGFQSSHFDEHNIVAHVRTKDRTDTDGKRVLFIEEFQSDWAQKGKKDGFETPDFRDEMEGLDAERVRLEAEAAPYASKGKDSPKALIEKWTAVKHRIEFLQRAMDRAVPSAPFVTKTESWVALSMKRMIRYAAENGYDRIAWTTGEQQADRYSLSKSVSEIKWEPTKRGIGLDTEEFDGARLVKITMQGRHGFDNSLSLVIKKDGKVAQTNKRDGNALVGKNIEDVIGKAASEKIMGAGEGTLAGEGLKIGGEGMLAFYDRIVPNVANDVLKKLGGGRVGQYRFGSPSRKPVDGEAGFQPGFDITPELKKKALSGVPLFQRQSDTKRGSLTFTGADAPGGRRFRIDLLEGANLSTFIHEGGHFWLEVMGDIVQELRVGDASKLNDKQRKMVEDYDALLAWMKVTDRGKIGTKQHEQFAEGIEAYFMEGKAPSPALRNLFARVRSWMLAIYRSINKLNVTLTPEVRAVFDRMLASDAEIEAAQNEAKIEALFTTPESAGMTPIEFAAYRERVTKASDVARDELQSKLMRTLTREREAWWKSEREKIRATVAEDVNARRDQIALSILTRDVLPNGDPLPYDMQRLKIRRNDVDAAGGAYGDDAWKTLPRGSTATDGLPLRTVAEVLGYGSGDELIKALRAARPANTVIEIETDAAMQQKHGDPMIDGTIHEAARAAVQNEERSAVIHAELRALARLRAQSKPAVDAERQQQAQKRKAGAVALDTLIPPLSAIRAMAARAVASKTIRDLNPMTHLTAARRASAEAVKSAGAGDWTTAIAMKRRELLNVELYRASTKAREEVEGAVDYMQSFGEGKKRGRIARAGQDYLDQIDGFLDRYDFAKVSLRALDRRKALATWIAEKEKAGEPVNLPDDVIVERRINYKDMTVDELRGVRDSVKHIEHLAKLKNRLLTAKSKKALDEVLDEIDESIRANATSYKGKQIESRLPTDETLRGIDSWFGMHRKLSSWIRQLDGLKDGGALWEYVMRPINEAGDREATMNAAGIRKLADLFSVYKDKDQRDLYVKQSIPEIGGSLTKMARLMVALNWGTADNRQKIMEGYGWNEVQVEAILAGLDARDWKFVQETWDYINSFWPKIEAKEKRINGIAPEKVEAQAVLTRFGEFAGGYFPLKYDDRQSAQAHGNRVKDIAEQQMKGGYARSTTRRGHTKERVEGVKLPIRLDFGVIDEHISQVIHDLTHHEMLIDVNRILGNKMISGTVIEVYGDVVYKQIQNAIVDIAAGNIPAIGAFEKWMNYTRSGATIAGLGWNMMTSLLQPLGLAQSIMRIGPKWVGKGLSRWIGDAAQLENTAAWIRAKSDFMANRGRTQMREINEIRNEIGITTGKLTGWVDQALRTVSLDTVNKQAVADSYFWLIQRGQMIADIPTWIGQYEKSMADPANDEARAIALADQAVLDSQGGGQMKDLAAIQRGGPLLKIWTSFYSYFNVTYNLMVEAGKRVKMRDPISMGRYAVDFLLLTTLPATLGALMKAALKGETDDEDKLVEKLIRENLSYLFGLMVGLREIGSVVQGFSGYEGPAGTRFFSSLSKLVKQVEQGETDAAFWRLLNDAAGIVLHYPAGQIRRSAEGLAALIEGDTRNPASLLFGPPKQN